MKNLTLMILALVALCSCNIFGLRDSQPPTEEAQWHDFASQWEMVLENLQWAYTDSRNAINYTRLFYDGFRFHFAPQDITDYSTDSQWDRSQEQDMLLNLHSRYHKMTVDFELLDTEDEISSTEAKIYRSYHITASLQNSAEVDLELGGNLELHLRKEYGSWYVSQWYDYRSANDHSWGRLKHENS